MSRKCTRCNYDIEASYILQCKSYEEILCPNCGRNLVATTQSKVLTYAVEIKYCLIITLFPIRLINIVFLEGIWIIISYYILPAFLFRYEEEHTDDEKDDMG